MFNIPLFRGRPSIVARFSIPGVWPQKGVGLALYLCEHRLVSWNVSVLTTREGK